MKRRFRLILTTSLLLAGAGNSVLATPEDDARADCKRKNICSVLVERYDANPRRSATLGEVLIAASEASAYGARLPVAGGGGGGGQDGALAGRVRDLEAYARGRLPDSLTGEIRKSEQYLKQWVQERAPGGAKDPRVDAMFRRLDSLVAAQGSHFGSLNGNVVSLSAAVEDLKERCPKVVESGGMMQRMVVGAGVAIAAIVAFALTGLE